jgi:hypothetical protein
MPLKKTRNLSDLTQALILIGLSCLSIRAFSQLEPLADQALSDINGRSFVGLDQYSNRLSGIETAFTRLTLKANIETLVNVNQLELGRYARAGETAPADIGLRHFALGQIEQDGSIAPFKMQDPFLEYATQQIEGKKTLVGIRFSFGQAQGTVSAQIEQLTGRLKLNLATQLDRVGLISASASLISAAGVEDGIRAHHFGVPTGQSVYFAGVAAVNQGCRSLWLATCYELSGLRSFEVSAVNDASTSDARDDMFFGFQGINGLVWGNPAWNEQGVTTSSGAFLNMPINGMNLSFEQAKAGIPRARTEYIDRGLGRWGASF